MAGAANTYPFPRPSCTTNSTCRSAAMQEAAFAARPRSAFGAHRPNAAVCGNIRRAHNPCSRLGPRRARSCRRRRRRAWMVSLPCGSWPDHCKSGPVGTIAPARANSGMRSRGAATVKSCPPAWRLPVSSSIQVVPAGRYSARSRARELAHRCDQQGRPEQVCVVDAPCPAVGGEIHYQWPHYRAVGEMSLRSERVNVWKQPVSQAVIVGQRFPASPGRRGR